MIDTEHLKKVGQGYFEHLFFALWICTRLLATTALLLIHAFLPFLQMPRNMDVARTSDFLFDKDYDIRVRRMRTMDKDVSDSK